MVVLLVTYSTRMSPVKTRLVSSHRDQVDDYYDTRTAPLWAMSRFGDTPAQTKTDIQDHRRALRISSCRAHQSSRMKRVQCFLFFLRTAVPRNVKHGMILIYCKVRYNRQYVVLTPYYVSRGAYCCCTSSIVGRGSSVNSSNDNKCSNRYSYGVSYE